MRYKTNIYALAAILIVAAFVGFVAGEIVPYSTIPVAVVVAFVLIKWLYKIDKSFRL